MPEICYAAEAELRHPRRFLQLAGQDLRAAPGIAWELHKANLRARHRHARLGVLWPVVPTLAAAGACIYLKSVQVLPAGATGMPYPVYVLCGMILWQVFLDSLGSPLQSLAAARPIITRRQTPHEAFLMAGMLEVMTTCGVRLLILGAVLAAAGLPLGATAALFPVGVVSLALLGLALGLLVAPLGMLYDDVGRGIGALAMLWFFITPVAYPAPAGLPAFNPVSPLLETTRAWLFGPAPAGAFAAVSAGAAGLLIFAWLAYRLARPHLIARLG